MSRGLDMLRHPLQSKAWDIAMKKKNSAWWSSLDCGRRIFCFGNTALGNIILKNLLNSSKNHQLWGRSKAREWSAGGLGRPGKTERSPGPFFVINLLMKDLTAHTQVWFTSGRVLIYGILTTQCTWFVENKLESIDLWNLALWKMSYRCVIFKI